MVTRAEIERDRLALRALVSSAQGELAGVLKRVPTAEQVARMSDSAVTDLYKIIQDAWWKVAGKYGTLGAVLGQAQASLLLEDSGFRAPKLPTPVGLPDVEGSASALITALGQDDWQSFLKASLDSTVKTANTWSLCDTLNDNGAEVIWYPQGKTCRYCLQRAAYGPYTNFRTEAQARGFATKPHDSCDCRPTIVPPSGDYPDGYRPDLYSRQIAAIDRDRAENDAARRAMGFSTPGPKTRESVRRDMSAKAWAERQRINAERDAAKKRIARADGDQAKIAEAQKVLDRTAAERAALNGTQ